MKQVLIVNADINKTDITQALVNAYRSGAEAAGASIRELIIADLIFNPNKQFDNRSAELEPDLQQALQHIYHANHLVIFSMVYKEFIPTKIKGFFDRLFFPDQVFNLNNKVHNNFSGKTARIISVLDEAAWHDWRINEKATYIPIKKIILEKCLIKPVRSSTIGYIQSLQNEYSTKWLKKLYAFGLKLI
jgi:putative NADPH-quinone reductase